VPVVVRTSYFPNWQASGAEGPWRLTPNFMVVVPTSRSVTLSYARSGPEVIGITLSVAGFVGLIGLVLWRPRDPDGVRPPPDASEPTATGPPTVPEPDADLPSDSGVSNSRPEAGAPRVP
jgi:hypothetical protein